MNKIDRDAILVDKFSDDKNRASYSLAYHNAFYAMATALSNPRASGKHNATLGKLSSPTHALCGCYSCFELAKIFIPDNSEISDEVEDSAFNEFTK